MGIKEELERSGIVLSTTVGCSMMPLLRNRKDIVVIKKNEKELRKYELILYQRPDEQMVLHRIIKIKGEIFYTRGDNTWALERVPKEWVFGVAVEIQRNGKRVNENSLPYRIYVYIWQWIYPVRWFFWKLLTLLK